MSAQDARVVVVGSFNVDHVWSCATLPRPGETLQGRYASGAGGKGFNQAVAAARAGASTSFICALGDDAGGQLARALAVADDIDLHDVRSTLPTGTAGIFVDAQGRNTIVIGAGANGTLSAEFVATQREAIVSAHAVLVQLESPVDAIVQALHLARAAGRTTVLNPAPANAVTTEALLALADILTPNETEFCALLARHCDESIDAELIAGMGDPRLHALCRKILPHGSVVVTLGAAGAFVSHPDSHLHGDDLPWYRMAAEQVDAIDTTGAGDAFNGALAASLARQPALAFREHARFATRYAGRSTEIEGAAASMPKMTSSDWPHFTARSSKRREGGANPGPEHHG